MEEQLRKIFELFLQREIAQNENIEMQNESNWDSLTHIELIMTLEEEFGISIKPDDIPTLTSSKAIIKKVKELTK